MNINGEASKVCVVYCRETRRFWHGETQSFVSDVKRASRFTPDSAALLTADFNGGAYTMHEVRYMGSKV